MLDAVVGFQPTERLPCGAPDVRVALEAACHPVARSAQSRGSHPSNSEVLSLVRSACRWTEICWTHPRPSSGSLELLAVSRRCGRPPVLWDVGGGLLDLSYLFPVPTPESYLIIPELDLNKRGTSLL